MFNYICPYLNMVYPSWHSQRKRDCSVSADVVNIIVAGNDVCVLITDLMLKRKYVHRTRCCGDTARPFSTAVHTERCIFFSSFERFVSFDGGHFGYSDITIYTHIIYIHTIWTIFELAKAPL